MANLDLWAYLTMAPKGTEQATASQVVKSAKLQSEFETSALDRAENISETLAESKRLFRSYWTWIYGLYNGLYNANVKANRQHGEIQRLQTQVKVLTERLDKAEKSCPRIAGDLAKEKEKVSGTYTSTISFADLYGQAFSTKSGW